jgi:hypothetical protein
VSHQPIPTSSVLREGGIHGEANQQGQQGRDLGAVGPFVDVYREKLRERRYTPLSTVNLLRQMAQMSRWLEAQGVGVEQLRDAHVESFVSFQRADGRGPSSLSRPGLLCLLELLPELGVVGAAAQSTPSPTDVLMGSFRRYLLSERDLSAGTVHGYVDRATRFVAGLAPGGLRDVTPAVVTSAVLRESAAVSVSATQNFVAGLRAFLRFCFIEGIIEVDLAQAALPVTGRRRSSLPRGITKVRRRAVAFLRPPHCHRSARLRVDHHAVAARFAPGRGGPNPARRHRLAGRRAGRRRQARSSGPAPVACGRRRGDRRLPHPRATGE